MGTAPPNVKQKRGPDHKKRPKPSVIGTCGHTVKPIRRERRMLWWCDDCAALGEKYSVTWVERKTRK